MSARMAETIELATIWLVDLVGSTRLATAVGPVRADSRREEYVALLRDAIDASGGREFKNTGDGLFVAFSSASAAVSCAVLTQQLFERRCASQAVAELLRAVARALPLFVVLDDFQWADPQSVALRATRGSDPRLRRDGQDLKTVVPAA